MRPGRARQEGQGPRRNGCPAAFIKDGQIKILDQVKFATSSTAIVPGKDSEAIPRRSRRSLVDHPEIKKVASKAHGQPWSTGGKSEAQRRPSG